MVANFQQSPEDAKPETPPAAESQNITEPAKEFPKKLAFSAGLVLVMLVVVVFGLSKTVFKQSNRSSEANNTATIEKPSSAEPRIVEQVFVSPVDGSRTDIDITKEYYIVGLGGTEYYGHVLKLNDDYLRLAPTAYRKSGVLVFSGNELHGPEQDTYFHISQIKKFQRLAGVGDEGPIVQFLSSFKSETLKGNDALPSDNISDYIKPDKYQAYFFADGSAFFAKASGLDGTFLANASHVYLLRTNSSSTRGTDISLVLAKPEQYNKLTTATLLYWQNMKSDGQISKAATKFEENQ